MKEQKFRVDSNEVLSLGSSPTKHYFFSGGNLYQGILVADLPSPSRPEMSKGQKLEILMDCSDRLHERYERYFAEYQAAIGTRQSSKLWTKFLAVHKAEMRISKKITDLVCS